MNRSEQRRWIVKLVFHHEFNTIEDIDSKLEYYNLQNEKFVKNSLESIFNNIQHIDDLIGRYSVINLNSISEIEKSILRVSINEFAIEKSVPDSVSINEAVEITKEFSSYDRHKFINGILSSVSKSLKQST